MASIFSTQNLQTFLRRKYLRPPSRPPGPPGPPGRGGRRSRSPPPKERSPLGRSPPEGRSPEGRSPPEDDPAGAEVDLVSSAMMLLKSRQSLVSSRQARRSVVGALPDDGRPKAEDLIFYAVTAAVSPLASAGGAGGCLRRASRSFLILSRRFCSSSMRTVRNLITGSVT